MHQSPVMRLMEKAVRKAGRALARDFGEIENLQVSRKGPGDFVSEADHRSEKILIEELQKSYPDYGFLVEERGEIKGENSGFRWVADPLDGTTNFLHGIPYFAISLALEKISEGKREIIAGIVYAPILEELYWAEKGSGAFVNSHRLSCSGRNMIKESLIGMYLGREGTSYGVAEKNLQARKILLKKGANMRILGSAALELAYVASGKLDGLWHQRLEPWDMAAGGLLVSESRGIISSVSGNKFDLYSNNILATNGKIHDVLQKTLSEPLLKASA